MQPELSSGPPAPVGGRFVVGAPLAQGAHGEVFAATDTLTGEAAVIKRARDPSPQRRAQARREAATLRALASPHLARLLDSGEDERGPWLAMCRVSGAPFPGALPRTWGALRPCLEATLAALAALHRLGLVHRDIKSDNVLVTEGGQPVIVDFGLAWEMGPQDGAGTPRTMAPEQAEGDEVDGRADLYPLGLLFLEALDGAPDLPSEVEALLEQMTAPDPEDRPASAGEVLRRLGARAEVEARVRAIGGDAERLDEAQLALLFTGHERVLRLRSDAARALWWRSGGLRRGVCEVLTSWLASGLASAEPDGFLVCRAALVALEEEPEPAGEGEVLGLEAADAAWLPWIRLLGRHADRWRLAAIWPEAPRAPERALPALLARDAVLEEGGTLTVLGWPPGFRARRLPVPRVEAHRRAAALLPPGARLPHLIAAGAPAAQIRREAERLAERALREGRPLAAIAVVERALSAQRRPQAGPGAERLMSAWARAALSLATPRELDTALFEAERTGAPAALLTLLHGARRVADGDGEGALGLLDALSPFEGDEPLEIFRQATRLSAAWRVTPPRAIELLESLDGWAEGRRGRLAALAGWRGSQAYLDERYEEALTLHLRSARGKSAASARRSSWLNAASAALERGDRARALSLARKAQRSAEAARHGAQALEGARLVRAAELRSPDAERRARPDGELVEVALSLGRPALAAAVALGEAALALRQGDAASTGALARRAALGFRQERLRPAALLAEALAVALSPDGPEAARLLAEAERCPVPGLAVQSAALAVWSLPEGPERAQARALLYRRQHECAARPEVRQEVLSLREIQARLSIGTDVAWSSA